MRRSLALALLLGIVVGPPALLSVVGFYDWGSLDLLIPGDIRLLLAGLTAVAWAAWGLWIAMLAIELVARLTSGRLRIRLPGLAMPQLVVGALLAAALASSVPAAQASAPAQAAVSASELAHAVAAPKADARQAERKVPGHRVAAGDDLWTLAERYYDDGREWRRIVAANPHLADDPTAELLVDAWLSIPDQVKLVKVNKDDTLTALAKKHLGDGERWPEIHKLNRSRVANPDQIDVGWVLKVPRLAPESAPEKPSKPTEVTNKETAEKRASISEATPRVPPASSASLRRLEPPSLPEPVTAPAPSAAVSEPDAHPPTVATLSPDAESDAVGALVGGMSSLAASMVLGGVAFRRNLKDRSRPAGRRFAHPDALQKRVESAMGIRQAAGREILIERALRHLAAHWFAGGNPAPRLEQAVIGETSMEFTFADEADLPAGFTRIGRRVVVGWQTLASLPQIDHPAAYPALVTLGADDDGSLIMIDLATSGVLGVRGRAAGLARESLSAMLIELTFAPWNDELELLVVTTDDSFARAAGGPSVTVIADEARAVAAVEKWASQRRLRLGDADYDAVRLDPVVAEAWRPKIALFEVVPGDDLVARLESALTDTAFGVAAALPVGDDAGSATWVLSASDDRSRTALQRVRTTHGVPDDARAAIVDLLLTASDTTTNPAPWWKGKEDDEVRIIELHPLLNENGPRVRLLGPIDLQDAAGAPPERAARQCLEYCAWLLEHPGSTAVEMASSLMIADGTRRSNMSRLRAWLGEDADGNPYLPEAYSGRIALADAVGSDWEQFQALVTPGVARTPPERLRLALELVRGAPLADAAPGQWHWAEEVRSDMVAIIRDTALVLARHARAAGDLELATWATNRGLVAAPEDELLICERIRVEHAHGSVDQVNRLVSRLTRSARVLGVDLLPETVELCQEVMEGRVRARRA